MMAFPRGIKAAPFSRRGAVRGRAGQVQHRYVDRRGDQSRAEALNVWARARGISLDVRRRTVGGFSGRLSSMAILNGLAFLITLAVGGGVWAMYTYEPGLLLGTPWGRVHVALLLAGAFLLGAAVVGMYVLAGWVTYRTRLSRHGRELRRTRGELDALKKGQIKEVPVIPDRAEP